MSLPILDPDSWDRRREALSSVVIPTMEGGAAAYPAPMDIVDSPDRAQSHFIVVRHHLNTAPYNVQYLYNFTVKTAKHYLRDSWHNDGSFCHHVVCSRRDFEPVYREIQKISAEFALAQSDVSYYLAGGERR